MNPIRIWIVMCAGFLLWTTCTTDDNKNILLSEAIHAVDDNPQEVLALLERFSPEHDDNDQYMQYIVALTQARYMNYQDITGDSLILDAQRYFAKKRDYEMAARASYYAATYWHEGEVGDKAVEYWQAAFSFAEKAGNNLFMAKSAYSLGMSYFNQEQWEDAMTYCQKALELYTNKSNEEHYLGTINMLGHIHWKQENMEQAYRYFDDGLKSAISLNNRIFESRFLRNKGIIHWEKKEYTLAKEYFEQALSKQPEPEDKLRIYLSYAKLYRDTNRPDSTFYYLHKIEEHIPEITYPITRRDMYAELATYYKSSKGNGDKIVHYLELAHTEDLRIKKSQSEKKIQAIHQQLEQLKQKKLRERQTYRRMFNYGLIALCLLVSLLIIIGINWHGFKEKYKEIRNQQFTKTVDHLHFLLAGLRSIAKGSENLHEKQLAYAGSPVWEQQLRLREEFSAQLGGFAKAKLKKMHNGKIALFKLTPEDLPVLQLSCMKFSDEEIDWVLGHKSGMNESAMLRKKRIRRILTEAGIREKDIKTLLP